MPVDTVEERRIVRLHDKLVGVLGPNEADTLMSLLLPGRWEFIADRNDVQRPAGV